jgi:HEAT repeat protein
MKRQNVKTSKRQKSQSGSREHLKKSQACGEGASAFRAIEIARLWNILTFRRFDVLTFLVVMLVIAGCESSPSTGEQVWSTRERPMADRGTESAGPAVGPRIPVSVDHESVREGAMEVLNRAAESTNALVRANAAEAIQHAPADAPPIIQRALGDLNRGVRFTAAMTVGDLKLCELSSLVRPLLLDESESVRAAALYALDRCNEEVDLNPLRSMIFSDNPEVRGNAAIVLGRLGNRTAIPMLRRAVSREMPRVSPERVRIVDLQIAEAIVLLGDDRDLEIIRASLFAPVAEQGEIVALACQMAGRLGDHRSLINLRDLATREGRRQMPPEIRMAAVEAIARMDPIGAPIEIPTLYASSDRFDHRAQAAMTLGLIDHPASANLLLQLLTDSNPLVQVAAAGGLLQRLNAEQRALHRP